MSFPGFMYCHELIHHNKTLFGIELCGISKVYAYNLIGRKDRIYQRDISLDQEVVAPIDIYNSKQIHNIR